MAAWEGVRITRGSEFATAPQTSLEASGGLQAAAPYDDVRGRPVPGQRPHRWRGHRARPSRSREYRRGRATPRGPLLSDAAATAVATRPHVAALENSSTLTTVKFNRTLDREIERASAAGVHAHTVVLSAHRRGTPQRRKRTTVVATPPDAHGGCCNALNPERALELRDTVAPVAVPANCSRSCQLHRLARFNDEVLQRPKHRSAQELAVDLSVSERRFAAGGAGAVSG